jgi:hypothetical protein
MDKTPENAPPLSQDDALNAEFQAAILRLMNDPRLKDLELYRGVRPDTWTAQATFAYGQHDWGCQASNRDRRAAIVKLDRMVTRDFGTASV